MLEKRLRMVTGAETTTPNLPAVTIGGYGFLRRFDNPD